MNAVQMDGDVVVNIIVVDDLAMADIWFHPLTHREMGPDDIFPSFPCIKNEEGQWVPYVNEGE